jgi:electron transfer flavoprotein alpha subunit
MSVLIFIEHNDGKFKKSSLEALSYGHAIAIENNLSTIACIISDGTLPVADLGRYGASKILTIAHADMYESDGKSLSLLLSEVVKKENASWIILSNTLTAKAIAPRLSVRLKAGLITGAISLPTSEAVVNRSVFSGKAFASVKINTEIKIITLNPNAYPVAEAEAEPQIIEFIHTPTDSTIKIKERRLSPGDIPLAEAERVVSGGRGLKGPENWGMIEDLAKLLSAATACSRPVADAHWRPHHEHVGQTGLTISPNLYIAIGISGAIQHLAGVNRSKTIVVINKDPEAPFFKSADYGIVGDAFEVVPKLIEAIKTMQA